MKEITCPTCAGKGFVHYQGEHPMYDTEFSCTSCEETGTIIPGTPVPTREEFIEMQLEKAYDRLHA